MTERIKVSPPRPLERFSVDILALGAILSTPRPTVQKTRIRVGSKEGNVQDQKSRSTVDTVRRRDQTCQRMSLYPWS
jgi:hypothetical protein